MPTKVLTARVPLELAEKVDQMAVRLERSHGWIMKQALTAWIDQEGEDSEACYRQINRAPTKNLTRKVSCSESARTGQHAGFHRNTSIQLRFMG